MTWYVKIGNEQRGPIGSDELKQLAGSGKVSESTPIKNGLEGKWSTAGKVKGLQFRVAAPPPLPEISVSNRKCPFCAEEIHMEAIKCKHCGEFLNAASGLEAPKNTGKDLDFTKLADSQRTLIIVLLLAFLLQGPVFLMLYSMPVFGLLTQFALVVLQSIACFRLANQLHTDVGLALILTILSMIPVIGLFVLLIVNGKATKILQAAGLKVGLLGVVR